MKKETIQKKDEQCYISRYVNGAEWKRPDAAERIEIDFDTLHDSLMDKMHINAIMESKSIELAASFRTNS